MNGKCPCWCRVWAREHRDRFAASFSGGTITAEGLKQALAQTNGWWAYDFVDAAKTDGVAVNPYFDDNKDGVLDIATEVRPKLRAFLERKIAAGGYIAEAAAFPTVADQASKLRMPVLVLHGANDALIPPETAVKLDALFAGRPYARKEYSGLGHSLGPATSLIDMAGQFKPIAVEPLADLAGWLRCAGLSASSGSTVIVRRRPARRCCQTPPTSPSTSNTGKLPACPPASARSAAEPGNSCPRGWQPTTKARWTVVRVASPSP